MMKAIVMMMFGVLGFSGMLSAQEAHVAIIKSVSGHTTVMRQGKEIPATLGMQLLRSDKVVSGQDSGAGLVFIDGTLVTLGEATSIEVVQYVFEPSEDKYDFALYMSQGTAIYSSGRLGKLAPEHVKLETPRATVGVRGTRYIIKVGGK